VARPAPKESGHLWSISHPTLNRKDAYVNNQVGLPIVVMTQLEYCPERGKRFVTCFKAPAWWTRKKPEGRFQNPWGEWLTMKKYISEVTKADKKWTKPHEPILAKCPLVAQLLTDAWWDDGTAREVCTMTVRVGLESTQINVNDAANEQSITTNAGSLAEALELLEEALAAGRNLWRKWGNFKKRK